MFSRLLLFLQLRCLYRCVKICSLDSHNPLVLLSSFVASCLNHSSPHLLTAPPPPSHYIPSAAAAAHSLDLSRFFLLKSSRIQSHRNGSDPTQKCFFFFSVSNGCVHISAYKRKNALNFLRNTSKNYSSHHSRVGEVNTHTHTSTTHSNASNMFLV